MPECITLVFSVLIVRPKLLHAVTNWSILNSCQIGWRYFGHSHQEISKWGPELYPLWLVLACNLWRWKRLPSLWEMKGCKSVPKYPHYRKNQTQDPGSLISQKFPSNCHADSDLYIIPQWLPCNLLSLISPIIKCLTPQITIISLNPPYSFLCLIASVPSEYEEELWCKKLNQPLSQFWF